MKPFKLIFALILIHFCASGILKAEYPREVITNMEPSKISLGEPVELRFQMNVPENAQLIFPVFNEKIDENLEILHYGTTDTLRTESGLWQIDRVLRITSWEEGLHPIKPFLFSYLHGGDTIRLESEPVLLEVEPFELAEDENLRDIKDVRSIPYTFREIAPWVVLVLLVIAIAWLLYRYIKSRKKKVPEESVWEKPEIPAHIAAFNSLENLRQRKLWQEGHIKLYYSELTDIIRKYIFKRYGVHAIEMTSDEILFTLEKHLEGDTINSQLRFILTLADLVKFAKHQPLADENNKVMDDTFAFVDRTKLEREAESANNEAIRD